MINFYEDGNFDLVSFKYAMTKLYKDKVSEGWNAVMVSDDMTAKHGRPVGVDNAGMQWWKVKTLYAD